MLDIGNQRHEEHVEDIMILSLTEYTGSARVVLFMASSVRKKEEYARSSGKRNKYHGLTMTHLLMQHHRYFLALEEPWVDMLLAAEAHIKGQNGWNCIM